MEVDSRMRSYPVCSMRTKEFLHGFQHKRRLMVCFQVGFLLFVLEAGPGVRTLQGRSGCKV